LEEAILVKELKELEEPILVKELKELEEPILVKEVVLQELECIILLRIGSSAYVKRRGMGPGGLDLASPRHYFRSPQPPFLSLISLNLDMLV
jgi:hypothetical protein